MNYLRCLHFIVLSNININKLSQDTQNNIQETLPPSSSTPTCWLSVKTLTEKVVLVTSMLLWTMPPLRLPGRFPPCSFLWLPTMSSLLPILPTITNLWLLFCFSVVLRQGLKYPRLVSNSPF